jgi:hypothetical protein
MNNKSSNRNIIEVDEETLALLNFIECSNEDDQSLSVTLDKIYNVTSQEFLEFMMQTNNLTNPDAKRILSIIEGKKTTLKRLPIPRRQIVPEKRESNAPAYKNTFKKLPRKNHSSEFDLSKPARRFDADRRAPLLRFIISLAMVIALIKLIIKLLK